MNMKIGKECVRFYEEIIKPLADEVQINSDVEVISYSMDDKLRNESRYSSLKHHKNMERLLKWYINSEYHLDNRYSCNIRIHRGVWLIVYNKDWSNNISHVEVSCANNLIKESIFSNDNVCKINKYNLKK